MTDLPTVDGDTCPLCQLPWDDHLLKTFRAHWAEVKVQRVERYAETTEPVEGPELGTFYDYVEVRAGGVQLPAGAVVAGAPRGLPVLLFRFASSDAATGPPELTAHLVMSEEGLRQLRLIVGSAIDSATKLGRRLR